MDARERFERTRRAVVRLNEVKHLIMYDCDDWKPQGVKSHGETSDPTAQHAIYAVDELGVKLEALRAEERELEQLIGESLVIVRRVREGLGDSYANALDGRYFEGWTYERIAEEYSMKKATAYRHVYVALDWIDSVGVSRLLRGEVDV